MWRAKYVLFDCDGVLVDSETLTQITLSRDLARYGLDIAPSEVGSLFVGGTMAGVMKTARKMGAALPDNWLEEFQSVQFAALAADCEIIQGVQLVLDQLDRAAIGYATCSNGPMAKMEVTLARCGLWDRFEGQVFTAHDCAASKPEPDVYLKAADAAGMDPMDCAVVEDSVTGLRAGRAAGMRCFGFAAATSEEKLAPYSDVVFHNMLDLPALLGVRDQQK